MREARNILIALSFILSASCSENEVPEEAIMPRISNVTVDASFSSASLYAIVSGNNNFKECGFFLWEDSMTQERFSASVSSDAVNCEIDNLAPDTDYYVCAFVSNGEFEIRSDSISFRTTKVPVPDFLSCSASPASYVADLSCELSFMDNVSKRGFLIAEKDSDVFSELVSETVSTVFRVKALWLNASTEYKYQAYVIVDGIIHKSELRYFTTFENHCDEGLWNYALSNFDSDKDGLISDNEADVVSDFYYSGSGVNSLDGIWLFKNVQRIWCIRSNITTLNVSGNPKVYSVVAEENKSLADVKISSNNRLTELRLSDSSISSIDLSGCPNLCSLDISDSNLAILDVSFLGRLTKLYADGNQLTEIDLSNNRGLDDVRLSNMPALKTIWLTRNQSFSVFEFDKTAVIKYRY